MFEWMNSYTEYPTTNKERYDRLNKAIQLIPVSLDSNQAL